jgi:hypothetical protein
MNHWLEFSWCSVHCVCMLSCAVSRSLVDKRKSVDLWEFIDLGDGFRLFSVLISVQHGRGRFETFCYNLWEREKTKVMIFFRPFVYLIKLLLNIENINLWPTSKSLGWTGRNEKLDYIWRATCSTNQKCWTRASRDPLASTTHTLLLHS